MSYGASQVITVAGYSTSVNYPVWTKSPAEVSALISVVNIGGNVNPAACSFNILATVDGTNYEYPYVLDGNTGLLVTQNANTQISLASGLNYTYQLPNANFYTSYAINITSLTGTGGSVQFKGFANRIPAMSLTEVAGASGSFTNITASGTLTVTGATALAATTVTSTSANAFDVGANGATNPVLKVNANTASVATGLTLVGAAAGSGMALQVISSGTNEALTIDAKAAALITLGGAAASATGVNLGSSTSAANFICTVVSSNATAFQVGPNGATNPTFLVNTNTASAATGLKVTSAAAGSGVAVAAISSGGAEALTVDAKSTGVVNVGSVSTGQVYLGRGATKVLVSAVTTAALTGSQTYTASAANVVGGLITATGQTGGGLLNLPTGTAISAALSLAGAANDFFVVPFACLTGQALTVTSATGATVIGTGAVPSGKNALLIFNCTGSNAFNVYTVVSA